MPITAAYITFDGNTHKISTIGDHPNGLPGNYRATLGCGMTIDTTDDDLASNSRWADSGASTCSACMAFEAGAPAVVLPTGYTTPTQLVADLETSMHCPKCSNKIFKRRVDGVFSCSGNGHEYSAAELMTHVKESFQSLLDAGSK